MAYFSLHLGVEHPGLWWVVVPAALTFLAGLAVGVATDGLRDRTRSEPAPPPD